MTETTSPGPGLSSDRDLEFDFLAKAAYTPEGTFDDKDRLWTKALGLKEVYAIARGQFPDIYPYIASNAGIASGQPLVKVFTDTDRLLAFAEANQLLDADGAASVLTLPVSGLIRAAHDYARSGIYGIHFNPDTDSYGFFTPFEQLPYIREHLDRKKAEAERAKAVDAALLESPPPPAPEPDAPKPVVVKIRRRVTK